MRANDEDGNNNGRLVVRDHPNLFWLFYSLFIVGGSTAPYLSLSAVPQDFAESPKDGEWRIEDRSLYPFGFAQDRLQSSMLEPAIRAGQS